MARRLPRRADERQAFTFHMVDKGAVATGEVDGLGGKPSTVVVDAFLEIVHPLDQIVLLLGTVVAATNPIQAFLPREGVAKCVAIQRPASFTRSANGRGDGAGDGRGPGDRRCTDGWCPVTGRRNRQKCLVEHVHTAHGL